MGFHFTSALVKNEWMITLEMLECNKFLGNLRPSLILSFMILAFSSREASGLFKS